MEKIFWSAFLSRKISGIWRISRERRIFKQAIFVGIELISIWNRIIWADIWVNHFWCGKKIWGANCFGRFCISRLCSRWGCSTWGCTTWGCPSFAIDLRRGDGLAAENFNRSFKRSHYDFFLQNKKNFRLYSPEGMAWGWQIFSIKGKSDRWPRQVTPNFYNDRAIFLLIKLTKRKEYLRKSKPLIQRY